MAICGIKWIDLTNNITEIFDYTFFLHSKTANRKKSLKNIIRVNNIEEFNTGEKVSFQNASPDNFFPRKISWRNKKIQRAFIWNILILDINNY